MKFKGIRNINFEAISNQKLKGLLKRHVQETLTSEIERKLKFEI
jgi:hypothetical protein